MRGRSSRDGAAVETLQCNVSTRTCTRTRARAVPAPRPPIFQSARFPNAIILASSRYAPGTPAGNSLKNDKPV